MLSTYSPDIVKRVTDPRTGLPSKSKFLPTVSEVKEACENLQQAEWRAAKRERDLENQFAERRRAQEAAKLPRPSLPEMREKYGDNWGLHPDGDRKKTDFLDLNQLAAKYGVDPEVVKALPDLPPEPVR